MALVINKVNEYEYTPLVERGHDDAFKIKFKPLNTRALAVLEDGYVSIKSEESIGLHQGTYNYKAIKTALISWENISDADGNPIPIKRNQKGEVLDETLDYLPPSVLTEIATAIINVSKYPDNAEIILGNVKPEDVSESKEKAENEGKRK